MAKSPRKTAKKVVQPPQTPKLYIIEHALAAGHFANLLPIVGAVNERRLRQYPAERYMVGAWGATKFLRQVKEAHFSVQTEIASNTHDRDTRLWIWILQNRKAADLFYTFVKTMRDTSVFLFRVV